ncbi:hypothetical protein, partial [Rheinheimera sp.]|uniref:hypothetical protein n=1 Tax=Rheinheimera sp. TaxID=1869214 RepID=UPI00307DB036
GLSRRGSRVRVPSAPPLYWVCDSVIKTTSLELVFLRLLFGCLTTAVQPLHQIAETITAFLSGGACKKGEPNLR